MSLSSALSTLEEVLLDIVENREPGAARSVGRGVDTVGARNTAGDGTYCLFYSMIPGLTGKERLRTLGKAE